MTHADRRRLGTVHVTPHVSPVFFPRRSREAFANLLESGNADRFQVGDQIEFTKPDGNRYWVTIFAIDPDGKVEAAFWDGLPNFFETTLDALEGLRIIGFDRVSVEQLAEWRRWPTRQH
ncbi:hypothetical protein RRU01S_10_01330 [Agrobacterium rubi TR3 = NBRC 13261]|uniref:Uncharacterized protein n=1 Tax=Agrobacterium rubi TR3 = NBRC 13261 TaxID=1368415 RepID=A0A081CUE8_9HYPH|nr:hypothetical protein [Agrobacterium rubi]MBP1879148.1 hypothetical protein [Agrobacterium rubi]GAK70294.1 hypothetical protein RRU01S_10_01330 [Agrobacterium rubi TR3 = NBRC 13261]